MTKIYRKIFSVIFLQIMIFSLALAAEPPKESKGFKPFPIYTDKSSPDNHYAPSGWMGDYGDLKINDRYIQNPQGGSTCIQWQYVPKGSNGAGWAGCFWQNPVNNWGSKKGGYNLTGAKKLVFWARGDKGGEIITEVGVGGINGEYADTDKVSVGPLKLTKEWKKYEINLEKADLSYISGGFFWVASSEDIPKEGMIFYLDNLKFE